MDLERWGGDIYCQIFICKFAISNIGEQSEMYNIFWSIKVIPSTQYFVGRAMLNKVATKKNLIRRGHQEKLFVLFMDYKSKH